MIDKNSSWAEFLVGYKADVSKHLDIPLCDYPIEARIELVDRFAQLAHNALRLVLEKLAEQSPK